MKEKSETDWAKVDPLSDDQIDTSDIPPLDDSFFSRAELRMPDEAIDKLYLLYKIDRGIRQADAGETVSHEEARERLAISARS